MKKNQKTKPPITQDTLKTGCHLRAKDLAQYLGISISSVWRLSRQGKLPKPIKLSEKVTVWKASDVLSWLESKEAA